MQTVVIFSRQWLFDQIEKSLITMITHFQSYTKEKKSHCPKIPNQINKKNIKTSLNPFIQLRLVVDEQNNIQSEPKIQTIIQSLETIALNMVNMIENTSMREQLYKRFKIRSKASWFINSNN